MKRIITIILSLVIMATAAACVADGPEPPDNDDKKDPAVTRLNGWTFRQLPSQSTDKFDDYMMSYMLIGPSKEVIVIDGGRSDDAEYLISQINLFGGTVDLWLLTHPHNDHITALDRILRKNTVTIRKVCYNFPTVADIEKYASSENAIYTQDFLDALSSSGVPSEVVRRGDTLKLGGLKIKVLTEPDPELTYDFVNSNSVAFKIITGEEDILILGDMSEIAGERLLKSSPDLIKDCEIVQMGHHGNGGPNEEFYKTVNPKTCFWPTPAWLWDCDNGGGIGSFSVDNGGLWATLHTRKWIEDLGITENYVMKDGLAEIK